MRNLPFIVTPRRKPQLIRIGNEDTGVFEIERRGYLTVTEKASFQQVVTNKQGSRALRDFVLEVSTAEKMPKEKAGELVSKALHAEKLTPKEEKILDTYAVQLLEVLDVFKREALHSQMIMATVLLVSRVDEEWTFEDTAGLDLNLIEQLAELYQAEELKSMEALSFMPKEEEQHGEKEPGKSQEELPAGLS